jgi:plasmid stabilization system protein ParE
VTYAVRLSLTAEADLLRLADFLSAIDASAARRGREIIIERLRSLDFMPRRNRINDEGLHELRIRFGDSGYIAQYRIDEEETAVVVARILHMREDR